MKIRDVLDIALALGGNLTGGIHGLEREVRFIEVMEVPEVEEWATEGLLVVTNFYSVKDDPEKQSDIISTLINKKAAGIIVKVGRFIERLPYELIELADRHCFPIITIPKEVAYIDLLTMLYGLLHKEGDTPADNHALHSFKDMMFHNIDEALEHLSSILNGGSVYIEDAQGLLLYASGRFFRDPWRKSGMAFSIPTYENFEENLEKWRGRILNDDHSYIYLPGKLSRLIIPLYTRQEIFAFIHLPFHNRTLNSLSKKSIESIQSKIYETLMSELLETQKLCMSQADELRRSISDQSNQKVKVILYFKNNRKFLHRPSRIIDYECMLQKKWLDLLKHIPYVEKSLIFEKEQGMYALVVFTKPLSIEQMVEEVSSIIDRSPMQDTRVGISPVFYHFHELEARVSAVTRMMDVGLEFSPGKRIYSYHQTGIYEYLIKLSQDSSMEEYVQQVLGPLDKEGDPELMETLAVYLQENGNASKAAEKLFIHRRTMTNRLLKIKTLLNMDLDNSEHVFILQFCLRIKRLSRQ